jgi:hypothetical protein
MLGQEMAIVLQNDSRNLPCWLISDQKIRLPLKSAENIVPLERAAETNKKLGLLSLKRVLPGVTLVPSTSLVIRSEVSIFSLCGKILGPDEL